MWMIDVSRETVMFGCYGKGIGYYRLCFWFLRGKDLSPGMQKNLFPFQGAKKPLHFLPFSYIVII